MNRIWRRLVEIITPPQQGFSSPEPGIPLIYGARRPGFLLPKISDDVVNRWIAYMRAQEVKRVVCLLPPAQLSGYRDLLGAYRAAWGEANVCWAPIEDFRLAPAPLLLETILPFLEDSRQRYLKTVVHCAGGIGRTGHVLAAWLVYAHGMSNEAAIQAVKLDGRNARESGDPKLDDLLNQVRLAKGG